MLITRIAAAAALAAALAVASFPSGATTVLPLYLDEIVATAAVAFEGTVIDNRVERDAQTGLAVTYTTFEVTDVIKGEVAARHTIKQVGGDADDGGLSFQIRGVPRFEVGESYVVFLAGVSAHGFSSPIGLSQGRFKVQGQGRERTVANGRDFRDMTRPGEGGMPDAVAERIRGSDKPVRELDLEDFKGLAKRRAGGPK